MIVALPACGDSGSHSVIPDELGGDTTVVDRSQMAFTHPAPNLDTLGLGTHQAGKGPFDFLWEQPQLGPLYNNDACFGCHGSNGRGESMIGPDMITPSGLYGSQGLVRCSMPTGTPDVPGGQVSVPFFGTQLQDHATVGPAEVLVTLTWVEHAVTYGDGAMEMLREPHLVIVQANGTAMPDGVLYSYRQAPPIIGLGLLEAIPDATILAGEDPDDADGDGISGHANHVWNPETSATELGRFGHKGSAPKVRIQTAGAFANDMGLSNAVFPEEDGVSRDVSDDQLTYTAFFVSTIAVPARGPHDAKADRGEQLFESFGCASCHVAAQLTGDHPIPQVANQEIFPFTDLLLHDMGDGLADGRPDFGASGSEWRTPPLWGIGLTQVVDPNATFLHDGRGRSLPEAILWHGGEAAPASEAFRLASKAERDALIAFLETL